MINNVFYNVLLTTNVEIYLSPYMTETTICYSLYAKQGRELEPYKAQSPTVLYQILKYQIKSILSVIMKTLARNLVNACH